MTDDLPLAVRLIAPARIVTADVRDELRRGEEPFARIMAARAAVPDGGALLVRAIFEPAPLYRVMERHGFAHHSEALAPDDWRIWFIRRSSCSTCGRWSRPSRWPTRSPHSRRCRPTGPCCR